MKLSLTGKKWACTVMLSLAFLLSIALPKGAAAVLPGETGYLSLHEYASPTADKNVFRVTLTAKITGSSAEEYLDIVLLLNTGHDYAVNNTISDPSIAGAAPFGYMLDTSGNATSIPRRKSVNTYNVWNAMCYSSEEVIKRIFDPAINPNYKNCRVSIVSYGNMRTGARGSQVWAGLTGYEDTQFLLESLGKIEDYYKTGVGSTAVSLSKGVQSAYRLLEKKGTPTYFSTSSFDTQTEFDIPMADGTTKSLPPTQGTWEPLNITASSGSITRKYILSMHNIGASGGGPNTSTATTYPINTSLANTPLNPVPGTTTYSYYDSAISQTITYFSAAYPAPYEWARYNILEASTHLRPNNNNAAPFHAFTLWSDPQKLTALNAASFSRWIDFNDSISKFPIAQGTRYQSLNSGYQDYSYRLPPSGNGYALRQRKLVGGLTYEYYEGMMYWNDASVYHNVNSQSDLENELADFISTVAKTEASSAVASGQLTDGISLYKQSGEPLFTINSQLGSPAGDASFENGTLTWNIGILPPDEEISLSFYVLLDEDVLTQAEYYPIFKTPCKINYSFADTSAQIVQVSDSFPSCYISLDGGVKANDSQTTDQASQGITKEELTQSTSGNNAILPLPMGQQNVYTPSATPNVQAIANESLEEEAEAIPVTNTDSIIYAVVALFVVCGIGFEIVRRRRKKQ